MKKWYGAAGICVNEQSELLMVLEGGTAEERKWSIPTGGLEADETFEECILREITEETGYAAEIVSKIHIKKGVYKELNIAYEVHYFIVKIIGGDAKIQDPEGLIHDIAWKSAEQLSALLLSYPEDRISLLAHLASPVHPNTSPAT